MLKLHYVKWIPPFILKDITPAFLSCFLLHHPFLHLCLTISIIIQTCYFLTLKKKTTSQVHCKFFLTFAWNSSKELLLVSSHLQTHSNQKFFHNSSENCSMQSSMTKLLLNPVLSSAFSPYLAVMTPVTLSSSVPFHQLASRSLQSLGFPPTSLAVSSQSPPLVPLLSNLLKL